MPDRGLVRLVADALEATFMPDVGMLGISLRYEGEELLALPGGVAGYRAGRQTGLALLAPWANRLGRWTYETAGVAVDLKGLDLTVDENGLPIHGTLTAASGWRVISADSGCLRAAFDYDGRQELLAAFPFPHARGRRRPRRQLSQSRNDPACHRGPCRTRLVRMAPLPSSAGSAPPSMAAVPTRTRPCGAGRPPPSHWQVGERACAGRAAREPCP